MLRESTSTVILYFVSPSIPDDGEGATRVSLVRLPPSRKHEGCASAGSEPGPTDTLIHFYPVILET